MAAGQGTRMRSDLAKMLHPLNGAPMLAHVLRVAGGLGLRRTVVVVGHQGDRVREAVADFAVDFVVQAEQRGTAHAVLQAEPALRGFRGDLLVLTGDVPLLTEALVREVVAVHRRRRAWATLVTTRVEDPRGYGRVLRGPGAAFRAIVEEAEATAAQRRIREINAGLYCFRSAVLFPALRKVTPSAVKGELYLPEVLPIIRKARGRVVTVRAADAREVLGVNTRAELAEAAAVLRGRVVARLMEGGVTCLDPATTYVSSEAVIGRDSTLYPSVQIEGRTRIGCGCTIHSGSRLRDAALGDGVTVLDGSVILGSTVDRERTLGPYAHLVGGQEQPRAAAAVGAAVDEPVRRLLAAGARIPKPASVVIGPEVRLEQVVPRGLTIHPGTKIYGEKTLILAGATLGYEEPVTLENAVLGANVTVAGGYVKDSVLLDGCESRQGFHAREGCLLEEQVYCAHNVGVKMTIAFPFVVLGSLINFCDCLIGGGTSRRNHSEIGSGFIHFNFSPRGEKATPSLFGDVPRGVLLREPPVFLGGLCGVVGPSRLGFGSVLSAGNVFRAEYGDGLLVLGEAVPPAVKPYDPDRLGSIQRKIFGNVVYLGQLAALRLWYHEVRRRFTGGDPLRLRLHRAAVQAVEANLGERLKQLDRFRDVVGRAVESSGPGQREDVAREQREFLAQWPAARAALADYDGLTGEADARAGFLHGLGKAEDADQPEYLKTLQSIPAPAAALGTRWLQSIVDDTVAVAARILPATVGAQVRHSPDP
jgi:UDP-N-acetylglucosamine/UDP-N-acetylgalactosamine diphosphorylase